MYVGLCEGFIMPVNLSIMIANQWGNKKKHTHTHPYLCCAVCVVFVLSVFVDAGWQVHNLGDKKIDIQPRLDVKTLGVAPGLLSNLRCNSWKLNEGASLLTVFSWVPVLLVFPVTLSFPAFFFFMLVYFFPLISL